jgi:hypothetical protein
MVEPTRLPDDEDGLIEDDLLEDETAVRERPEDEDVVDDQEPPD